MCYIQYDKYTFYNQINELEFLKTLQKNCIQQYTNLIKHSIRKGHHFGKGVKPGMKDSKETQGVDKPRDIERGLIYVYMD